MCGRPHMVIAAARHRKPLHLARKRRIVKAEMQTSSRFSWSSSGGLRVTGFQCPESKRSSFMNLTISGHHLEVSPALRNYVTEKLDRITRHFDQVVDVRVLLSIEKQKEKERRQRAECNIHVKGNDLFAESASADLYAAVDELVDKLDRQVVRHKDRIQNHQHDAPKRLM
jgi:putative sigma-54 modulation protein